jgi:hypothetical protein
MDGGPSQIDTFDPKQLLVAGVPVVFAIIGILQHRDFRAIDRELRRD